MNYRQRNQNRRTAAALAEEVYETNLPDGLRLRRGSLYYDCVGCERECEWYGTPEEFDHPDAIKLGGCSERCCP